MVLKHITSLDEFKSELSDDKIVIVDFWAPWCGPCKMFGPVFERTAGDYEISFIKVNVDEAEDIAREYNIMSLPTVMIIKGDEIIEQKTGALSPDSLKDLVEKNLDDKDLPKVA